MSLRHIREGIVAFFICSSVVWGRGPCDSLQPPSASSHLIDEILKIDVEATRRRYAGLHFKEDAPLDLVPNAGRGRGVPAPPEFRLMSLHMGQLLPTLYTPTMWRNKLLAFGKTLYLEKPDLIAVNSVYEQGMQDFARRILYPLGYEWLIDVGGGKHRHGHKISSGLIYDPKKFKVERAESIGFGLPNKGVPETRNIVRVTLRMRNGLSWVVYVVHFKSEMPLMGPIQTSDVGPIHTTTQLRRRQMEVLRTHVNQDMAVHRHVIVMGNFNTGLDARDFMEVRHLNNDRRLLSKEERKMLMSATPIRQWVDQGKGVDIFSNVRGYSHVFRGRGRKTDHMLVFPDTCSMAMVFSQVHNRKILRYPWHMDERSGYPLEGAISDHLPLVADIMMVNSVSAP